MRSLVFVSVISFLACLSINCTKGLNGDESDLYGTWAKGSGLGDTLWFMKKNGKNVIRIPESFNPSMPIYAEKEYQFKNGVLNIKSFAPSSQEYFPITSFVWINKGKEFAIQNSELFVFMSSIINYRYKKI